MVAAAAAGGGGEGGAALHRTSWLLIDCSRLWEGTRWQRKLELSPSSKRCRALHQAGMGSSIGMARVPTERALRASGSAYFHV